ncbi:uncharacterized protein LOC128326392 [Hemicordylus capensis]|uniref:uncharacterized protein LOC128326392 n=1 Tax=Hemicordylus capensis TaxID=884348 RepID=UPI002302F2B8|nr:uncharacterized protein LOC128326392 [Hemicordylus capensis]
MAPDGASRGATTGRQEPATDQASRTEPGGLVQAAHTARRLWGAGYLPGPPPLIGQAHLPRGWGGHVGRGEQEGRGGGGSGVATKRRTGAPRRLRDGSDPPLAPSSPWSPPRGWRGGEERRSEQGRKAGRKEAERNYPEAALRRRGSISLQQNPWKVGTGTASTQQEREGHKLHLLGASSREFVPREAAAREAPAGPSTPLISVENLAISKCLYSEEKARVVWKADPFQTAANRKASLKTASSLGADPPRSPWKPKSQKETRSASSLNQGKHLIMVGQEMVDFTVRPTR